jgi:hypothetical protein
MNTPMSAPTRTKFLSTGLAASPAQYHAQHQQLDRWAVQRAEQLVFCHWIAKELLGYDVTIEDVVSLVDEYTSLPPQKTTPTESAGVE